MVVTGLSRTMAWSDFLTNGKRLINVCFIPIYCSNVFTRMRSKPDL